MVVINSSGWYLLSGITSQNFTTAVEELKKNDSDTFTLNKNAYYYDGVWSEDVTFSNTDWKSINITDENVNINPKLGYWVLVESYTSNPKLLYYNNCAISGRNSIESNGHILDKSDYDNLTNTEFILECKNRLLTTTDKAFVISYTDSTKTQIHKAYFKSDVSTAYYKPGTSTGQQVYSINETINIEKLETALKTNPVNNDTNNDAATVDNVNNNKFEFTEHTPFSIRDDLKTAVELWMSDKNTAIATFGEINTWNVSKITSMVDMFVTLDNEGNIIDNNFNDDISNWDVSNVTTMYSMFASATLFNQPLNNWDVSNVTNMRSVFYKASSFNQPLNNWNMSNVTTMRSMFYQAAAFNQDISQWNVSKVTNMQSMFNGAAAFNQDISQWNVSNVTNMLGLFYETAFNQDIGSWDVNNVTDMGYMFNRATSFNQDIGNWNTSKVTDMKYMFAGRTDSKTIFNKDISRWNVANVTDMEAMFDSNKNFNRDIGNWDTSNVTNMSYMFYGTEAFNQDIGRWNVSNVATMRSMFSSSSGIFNQDISTKIVNQGESDEYTAWDTSNVTNMSFMFYSVDTFNQDISSWNLSNITTVQFMFAYASAFNQDIRSWNSYLSQNTTTTNMFLGATAMINNYSVNNYDDILDWFNDNLKYRKADPSKVITDIVLDNDSSRYDIKPYDLLP